MSTFGPIAYEDMALLNAQWQQARPAVHGLGGVAHFGQHDYRDLSYLNARLRPILPAEVGMPPPSTMMSLPPSAMGGGSLSGNSLGVDSTAFTKEQILLAQDLVNGALVEHGYKQIDTDGKLGPATCGAIQWYQQNVDPQGGASFTGACAGVTPTPPTKLGGGTIPSSHPAATPAVTPTRAGVFGTGGGTNWMLWGGAIAAVAVGGALIFKASKKR
jgi:hypothetical protein